MVKDHRTDFEMGNTQAVLDGDLVGFMEAFFENKRVKRTQTSQLDLARFFIAPPIPLIDQHHNTFKIIIRGIIGMYK